MQGGEYEFAPFIRGKRKGEENFEEVAKLFDGSYDNNIVKNAEEGTLNLFNGERYVFFGFFEDMSFFMPPKFSSIETLISFLLVICP